MRKTKKLQALIIHILLLCEISKYYAKPQGFNYPIDRAQFIFQKYSNYPPGAATITTYRPNFEKLMQSASNVFGSTSGNSESNGKSILSAGGITGFLARSAQTIFSPVKSIIDYSQIRAIFPGTRWCGDGNISTEAREFGVFHRADYCCKQHDLCPLYIVGGQTFGPLANDGFFTRSWCPCDLQFYECLKQNRGLGNKEIGSTYFTFLGPQCFDIGPPIVSCVQRGGKRLIDRKCTKYLYDITKEPTLQWYDTPDF